MNEYDCAYRLLGECPECVKNYNPDDPLSNLYCERYHPARESLGCVHVIIDDGVKRNIIEELKRLYRRK
jgi:hypothetical protein